MKHPRDPVLQALELRLWALGVLARGPGSGWSGAPSATPEAWALFLAAERCATPLAARLGAPAGGGLDEAAAQRVDAARLGEQRRFLSAAAQARQLARWLGDREWPVAVLKGGVAALEGADPVDVLDLDVLTLAKHAQELAALLQREGGHRGAYEEELPGTEHLRKHLPQQLAPGGIQVEIHRFVPDLPTTEVLLARSVALPRPRRLLRLAPPDHLWHLLSHGAVHHPDRRGMLRELVLLRAACAACGVEERREVAARAAAHRAAPALGRLLALADGAGASDPFSEAAALRYLLRSWRGSGPLPGRLRLSLSDVAFALLDDEAVGWGRVTAPQGHRSVTRLGRGAVPAAATRIWRGGRLAAAAALAYPLVRRARAAAARVGAPPGA